MPRDADGVADQQALERDERRLRERAVAPGIDQVIEHVARRRQQHGRPAAGCAGQVPGETERREKQQSGDGSLHVGFPAGM
jgi:hypothetical protein